MCSVLQHITVVVDHSNETSLSCFKLEGASMFRITSTFFFHGLRPIGVNQQPSQSVSLARLVIPLFRNLFFVPKKAFLTGFLRIFLFSCVFLRNFSEERGFGEVAGIPAYVGLVQTGLYRQDS